MARTRSSDNESNSEGRTKKRHDRGHKRKRDEHGSSSKKKAKEDSEYKYRKAFGTESVITVRCNLEAAKHIKDFLTPTQVNLFRKSCFGQYLDMTNTVFAGVLCHILLTREIICEDLKPRELCFKVRGVELRFGDWEFGLLSGLRFGDMEAFTERFSALNKPDRFRKKFFSDNSTAIFRDVDTIMKQTVWKNESDQDAVSFAMLYFVIGYVLDNTTNKQALPWVLELAEFPTLFNEFSWGVLAWDVTYRSLVNGMIGGKGRIDQLLAYRDRLRTNRVSLNLYGFAHVFQLGCSKYGMPPTDGMRRKALASHDGYDGKRLVSLN